jgi:tetratricopeptide (TPR) repeat protein
MELDEADKCYDEMLKRDPNQADALCGKGCIRIEKKDHVEAIKLFDSALEIDKDNPTIWTNKGRALEVIGDFENAQKCYYWASRRLL